MRAGQPGCGLGRWARPRHTSGYGRTRSTGGDADVRNRREEGVLPEIVGLPPDDFVEQVGFDPSMLCRCCEDGKLELPLVAAPECALGQEPFQHPFQGHRICPAGPGPVEGVDGQAEEDLARKGVVLGMQGRQLAEEIEYADVVGPARRAGSGWR